MSSETTAIAAPIASPTPADADQHLDHQEHHPLHSRWTLSYNGPIKNKKDWNANVKNVMTFGTVEEFWGLYNNIPKVDDLANQSDYNLFREGIFPGWEDDANREGGKWLINIPGHDLQGLGRMWLESCLFAIGEAFEDPNQVCGIVVSVRERGHKLCLWTRDASSDEVTKALGKAWKEALELHDKLIKYSFHSESLQTQRSFPKGDAYAI
ncbi:translation initiation factor eIF 4e-like domain-containing protein [Blastocladiella britannica]|nr:translation initiation factor eIF 4e-like domain-containing protein [Blastocladiella britannica]